MSKTTSLSVAASLILAYALLAFPFAMYAYNNNYTGTTWDVVAALLYALFCVQLFVQAIYTLKQSQYATRLTRQLAASGLIIVPPFLAFVVAMALFVHASESSVRSSEQIATYVFMLVPILQIAGSVWQWVLISGTKKPQARMLQQMPVAPTQQSAATGGAVLLAGNESPSVQSDAPARSHKKLGIALLCTPVLLYLIGLGLMTIASIADPAYDPASSSPSSIHGVIINAILTLCGVLFLPCVIAGIILTARRR